MKKTRTIIPSLCAPGKNVRRSFKTILGFYFWNAEKK